jgi:Na+/melibiose symporter-like transporter
MLLRVLCILAGYVVACAAFALVLVAFVFTPAEMASADAERFSMAGFQLLASSIQVIIFAAPLALLATAFAEWRGISDWIFYALAAMLIAGVGFVAQYFSELQGAPTIVNNYAVTAFMTGGFVAGVVYWLIAGRHAATWRRTIGPAGGDEAAKTT